MNIIMIGMPGCGKSTVGVLLAKSAAMDFIDCDLVIQKRYGSTLQRIIDTKGIDFFRMAEEETILNVRTEDCVIATGGSAVYSPKAMEHLKKNGIVIYISLPIEEIKKRLTNIKTRGVAMNKGQTIDDLYIERRSLYEGYADITVDASGLSIEETVERCAEEIKAYLKK